MVADGIPKSIAGVKNSNKNYAASLALVPMMLSPNILKSSEFLQKEQTNKQC